MSRGYLAKKLTHTRTKRVIWANRLSGRQQGVTHCGASLTDRCRRGGGGGKSLDRATLLIIIPRQPSCQTLIGAKKKIKRKTSICQEENNQHIFVAFHKGVPGQDNKPSSVPRMCQSHKPTTEAGTSPKEVRGIKSRVMALTGNPGVHAAL